MEEIILQIIAQAILLQYPVWRIYRRAGLRPAGSLAVLIPFLGVFICALMLALSKWQVQPSEVK